jgi:hypothetical protein
VATGACTRIGFGPGSGSDCPRQAPTFLAQLELAIDQLYARQPEIFDGEKVLSVGRYYVGLINALDEQGLCADTEGGEELAIKSSNEFNDQFDVLTADLTVRRGASAYRGTCSPAAFPKPQPSPPPTAGCSLPGSREKACGRETSQLLPRVEAAIDKAFRDHPDYFSPSAPEPGSEPRVVNDAGYFAAVVANLTAAGACARFDGEEVGAKADNRSSEQFDIHTAQGRVRRGEGAYRATCYPAAF